MIQLSQDNRDTAFAVQNVDIERFQLHRMIHGFGGAVPVPLAQAQRKAQAYPGRRQVLVKRQRLFGRLARKAHALGRIAHVVVGLETVCRRQFRPGRRVARVDCNGFLECDNSILPILPTLQIIKVPGLEIKRENLRIRNRRSFGMSQYLHLQRGHDRGRNLILYGKDIVKGSVVLFGIQIEASAGVDKLHRDAYGIVRLAHAAFEHMPYVQLLGNLFDLRVTALERKRRCPRGDL